MHVHYALLTILFMNAHLYCMDDDMQIDPPAPYDEKKETQNSGYVRLQTILMPYSQFNDSVRLENLRLIKHNINININRINGLPIHSAETKNNIITRLQEITQHASGLQQDLSHVQELTSYNQKILQNKIDQFCDKDFEDLQDRLKQQVDKLANTAQQSQPPENDFDVLLYMLNTFKL